MHSCFLVHYLLNLMRVFILTPVMIRQLVSHGRMMNWSIVCCDLMMDHRLVFNRVNVVKF